MRTNVATIALACLGLVACDRAAPREAAKPTTAQSGTTPKAPVPSSKPTVSPPAVPTPEVEPSEPPPVDDGAALAQIEPELEIPEIPLPPEDYGQLALSEPPPAEDELVVHALAGYEVVAVYAEPNIDAPKLGYLRLGTRLKVTKKVGTNGCPKGWHALPAGGFACASKGLVVDAKRPPYLHRPPPPARLEQSLPYRYAYVRKWNSPMWWRIPTAPELAEA
ncbi:MAG: SH3 domain-containing protein, partial [Myxococcales bacterium]|nr:SH3 domain-containing protein [Myxococcales bacterium]